MKNRTLPLSICVAFSVACPAWSQDGGLRLSDRAELGLNPALARGLLGGQSEHFGFAQYRWRDAAGFAPSQRFQWTYSFSDRGSLGLSYAGPRGYDPITAYAPDSRIVGLFGRYSIAPEWSLSGEAISREPGSLLRLRDFRIGVQRQF